MLITAPFPFNIDPELKRRNPTAVFKLVFGTTHRYFIFKGLRIYQTAESLSKQINKEINEPKEDSIMFKVVAYIKRARPAIMNVELIFESDSYPDILMAEYEALQAAKKDPNCLNTRFTNIEYFPHWISHKVAQDYLKWHGGRKPTNKEKNLRKFLNTQIRGKDAIDAIVDYIKDKWR